MHKQQTQPDKPLSPDAKPPVNVRKWLIAIIVIAVLLRVAAALYLGNQVVELPGTADQLSYHNLALRLLGGHGFTFGEPWWPATPAGEPTAHWSYLYTMYLVVVYFLTGSNPLVARLLQAVAVGILMPWLTYRLARLLFSPQSKLAARSRMFAQGEMVGLVAAGITAVYIYFVYYAAALMTESFYIVAILWSFVLAVELVRKKQDSWRDWVLLGIALAAAVLLRQLFMLFIPFMLLWLWWAIRPRLYKLALPLVVLVLAILPWTIRNYLAFDYFVLLNTNSGFAFYWGNHPIYGTHFIPILTPEEYRNLLPPDLLHLNEAELDSALMGVALKNVMADPLRYVQLSLSRIPFYFEFWPSSDSGLISNISRVGSFGLFLPFMLIGLVRVLLLRFPSWRDWLASPFTLIYLFVLFYTAVHVLIWTLVRYRLPIDALMIIFAGSTLWWAVEWIINRKNLSL